MRRAAALVLVMVGCSKRPGEGGLVVHVVVAPTVKADCVVLVASSPGGEEHPTEVVPRKDELVFGVAEGGDLHGEAHLVARGLLGPCSGPSTLNAQSAERVETFEAGKVRDVEVRLEAALDDADRDGYRAREAGGTDCDDGADDVAPGLDERCADGKDNDCDGRADCADTPRCDSAACDDGLACTESDVCGGGVCRGAERCTSPDPCTRSLGCGADGGCRYARDAGSPCDGGFCRETGECIPVGIEWSCIDGVDNDGDQQIDCDDADCAGVACDDGRACTRTDTCQSDVGCMGVITCDTPPSGSCWSSTGGCGADGGCEYFVMPGAACDDGLRCTAGDVCSDTGVCAGAPYSCGGMGSCFAGGTCEGDGGCTGTPLSGTACDDQNACTFGDTCAAGACAGVTYDCLDTECATAFCRGDGGCGATPFAVNTPCSGGACDGLGTCVRALWPFTPSNFAPAQIPDGGYGAPVFFDAGCDAVFDSTDGGFTGWCGPKPVPVVVTQLGAGGPPLVVLPVQGLVIAAGARLRLVGSRPVAIAVTGDAVIAGAVLATSDGVTLGAGGSWSGCGTAQGSNGGVDPASQRGGGGGGGAFATGGSSGAGITMATAGRAGAVVASSVRPLRGGCSGGDGAAATPANAGRGGSGGGALQLSVSGTLSVTGIVSASGAGGRPGAAGSAGAGGGGSGGALLLEANVVVLDDTAALTCNGGGGGEGSGTGIPGRAGADGAPDSGVYAPGGSLGTSGGGDGANGASRGVDAGAIVAAVCVPAGSGGEGCGAGGGGLGRLRVEGYQQCLLGPPTISAVASMNCP